MKSKRKYLITSLIAAGFNPPDAEASLPKIGYDPDIADPAIAERLKLEHMYDLAGHRSHSSHSSHRSSSGGGYTTPTYPRPYVSPAVPQYVNPPVPQSNSTAPSSILPSSPTARALTLKGNTEKFMLIAIRVQTALTSYGYYDGAIDGKMGPKSKIALSSFQKDFGLKVTGTITPEVLDAFGIEAR